MIRQTRIRLAGWVSPQMCSASRGVVMSYRGPDRIVDGEIVPGTEITHHRACGKRPGHKGAHGPWGRWFRWRNKLADLLEAGL